MIAQVGGQITGQVKRLGQAGGMGQGPGDLFSGPLSIAVALALARLPQMVSGPAHPQ